MTNKKRKKEKNQKSTRFQEPFDLGENQHYPYLRNLSKNKIIEYKYFDNCYKHRGIFYNI